MIKSVEIINSYGEKIKMVLDDPELNGYAITNISGIEPVQVDIKQTQLVSGLKYKYNFGFYKSREITFSIVYLEWLRDQDEQYVIHRKIEESRDNLYKYFKTNDKIQMIFERGRRDGNPGTQLFYIEGYVSKHQPTFFSQSCGATISVTCPDPWFKECWWTGDPSDPVLNFITTVESDSSHMTINYPGDIFTGFKFTTNKVLNNYSGKSINLRTWHNSVKRDFVVNVPLNYNSYGLLEIDLISDIISVSLFKEVKRFGDEYYAGTIKSTNHRKIHILEYGEEIRFTGVAPDQSTQINNITLKVDNQDTEIRIGNNIEKHPLFKVLLMSGYDYTDPNMTKEIAINDRPDHDYDIRVKLGLLSNDYCYLYDDDNVDKNEIYYSEDNNLTISDNNVGFVFGNKILEYDDEIKNRNGWIDSTSISKRQEIPMLYPGSNIIQMRVDGELETKNTFKIEYYTLYRGL